MLYYLFEVRKIFQETRINRAIACLDDYRINDCAGGFRRPNNTPFQTPSGYITHQPPSTPAGVYIYVPPRLTSPADKPASLANQSPSNTPPHCFLGVPHTLSSLSMDPNREASPRVRASVVLHYLRPMWIAG